MTFSLEHPELLLLIIPLILGGFYLLRNTKTKLVEWRMLVALLLIIALASPFTVVTKTTTDENPNLVIISDETGSMDIFEEGVGQGLYEGLVDNTPTSFVRLTGDKTSLGDSVLQYAGSGQQVVLVSDGNNNHGKSLVDALEFARETGTKVYSVQPALEKNDLAVEVRGDKTIVVDNENEFEVLVSQAGKDGTAFTLEVYLDGKLDLRRSYSFAEGERETSVIYRPDPFTTLGAHNIRVKITPSGEDWNAINNEFYKALYVVSKPKVTLITDEPDSPLGTILSGLYELTTSKELPDTEDLEDSKVLLIDNQHIDTFSEADVKKLKSFVSGGKGLIVVGGDLSYDETPSGNYRNSSLEELLPVISRPSKIEGKNYIILLLDLSGSTLRGGPESVVVDGVRIAPLYPLMTDSAKKILQSEGLEHSKVGIVVIGDIIGDVPAGMEDLNAATIGAFEESLESLAPTNIFAKTDLSQGILDSKDMLEESAPSDASKFIIIITDGVEAFDPGRDGFYTSMVLDTLKEVHSEGINFRMVDIESTDPTDGSGSEVLKQFMDEVDGVYIAVNAVSGVGDVEESLEKEVPEEEKEEAPVAEEFELYEYNPTHFITKNVEVSGELDGFNDVTPKAGAERIITVGGKPLLTAWRYGLGRVVALTTDNGGKKAGEEGGWGTALYTGPNARLISSMTNWAIANPYKEEGLVLEGPDTWLGDSSKLTATMYEEGVPKIKLGDDSPDLALTGKNTYEATISPDSVNVHDVSAFILKKKATGVAAEYQYDYPIAVNYPQEFRAVGINKDIESLILATGGKTYEGENEARAFLLKDARENSEREVQEPQSLKMYFVLAALLLFLGEVMVRRIREIKKLKKAHAEQEAAKEATEIDTAEVETA